MYAYLTFGEYFTHLFLENWLAHHVVNVFVPSGLPKEVCALVSRHQANVGHLVGVCLLSS